MSNYSFENNQLGQSHSALATSYSLRVSDEGAVTPFETNLCLLMEWTEGTALGKK